ncbi:Rieske (2Fe-2S) protein [Rhodococcus sp. NPDC003994]
MSEERQVLAVGTLPDGTPFAVGNVCRHQPATLGRGRVTDRGCLECPWHGAEYDVRTGKMDTGPQGMVFGFPPDSAAVRAIGSLVPLSTRRISLLDGWICLVDG